MTTTPVPTCTDDLLAELDRFANNADYDSEVDMAANAAETIRALLARLRAAEVDAGRYRWLREQEAESGLAILPVGRWVKPAMLCTTPFDSPEMVDSVVDAAIKESKQ